MSTSWLIPLSKSLLRKLKLVQPDEYVCCDVIGESFTPHTYDSFCPKFAGHFSFVNPVQPHQLYARCVLPQLCTKAALVPVESRSNDEMCVEHRIEKVRNYTRLTRYYKRLAREYQHQISNRIGKIAPLLHQEAIDLMPRRDRAAKLQKRLDELIYAKMSDMRTFQKPEAYDTVKAPRNISPVPDEQLLEMSRYVYPFYQRIKEIQPAFGWWAPGHKPLHLAEQVARVTKTSAYFGADYSKFDGHQNRHLRRIVRDIVADCLDGEDKADWIRRFEMEIAAKAKTKFGVSYDANGSMLSGSAITTIGNTLLNGFVYFCACVRSGIPMNTALKYMDKTCILYGDDSAGPMRIRDSFFRVCEELGIEAKEEDKEFGLVFLGRVYYKDGGIYSIFDPRRIFPKLHITTANLSVPIANAACNRAHGLLSSCKGEEWIEIICKCILKDWGNLAEDARYYSAEELYNLERRESLGLPTSELDEAYGLVERMLGTPPFLLHAVLKDYRDGRRPCCWIDNGQHKNKFDKDVYVTDILNTGFQFQVRLAKVDS